MLINERSTRNQVTGYLRGWCISQEGGSSNINAKWFERVDSKDRDSCAYIRCGARYRLKNLVSTRGVCPELMIFKVIISLSLKSLT